MFLCDSFLNKQLKTTYLKLCSCGPQTLVFSILIGSLAGYAIFSQITITVLTDGENSPFMLNPIFMDFSLRISLFPGLELMCITTFLLCSNPLDQFECRNCLKHSDIVVPVIGLVQASHFLAYRLPKHLRQYGLSSREVKCCPASCVVQLVHTKHSLCHGSSR